MMALALGVRILLVIEPQDMRKSFNGLPLLAGKLGPGLLEKGALFVLSNRRRNLLKALYFDRTGICVLAKRLEKGTFSWPPATSGQEVLELAPEALQLLVDGVDLLGARMRPWYQRE